MRYLFFFLLLFCFVASFSQSPSIQWQKCIGGTGYDAFGTLRDGFDKTNDGGFIIATRTNSDDGDVSGLHIGMCGPDSCTDGWVIKLDSIGNIVWQKCLGGTKAEFFSDVHQTLDGGYIAIGMTFSNDGDVSGNHSTNGDFWICKLDFNGNIEWQKCLGGTVAEIGLSICQTSDSGYVVAGLASSNNGDVLNHPDPGQPFAWIVKLNNIGIIEWQKCLPNSSNSSGSNVTVIQVNDGGFAVASTGSNNVPNTSIQYCLSKLDNLGNVLWQKFYGGGDVDEPSCVIQTRDQGFLICGYAISHDGDVTFNHRDSTLSLLWHPEYWIVKTDSVGNLTSQKSLGGNWNEWASTIEEIPNGYIVSGTTESNDGDIIGTLHGGGTFGGPSDCWVVELDTLLNINWQKCLGGFASDIGESVCQTIDGGYIFKSSSFSNGGDVMGNHGNGDTWIVKMSSVTDITKNTSIPISDFSAYLSTLNHAISISFSLDRNEIIQFELLDATGRIILHQPITGAPGFNKQEIISKELNPGIYIALLMTFEGAVFKKLIAY